MPVAMANRVLLPFIVILASVAVSQAERIQGHRGNSEAIRLQNEDITNRGRADRSDGQQNSYREQNKKDEYRTAMVTEPQLLQVRRTLDQRRSEGSQEDPIVNNLSRNERRSYGNEETNKEKRRNSLDDKVLPIKENRRNRNEEIIRESRRITVNDVSLPSRINNRKQKEEPIEYTKIEESPRRNDRKRLSNESIKQRPIYLNDPGAPANTEKHDHHDPQAIPARRRISSQPDQNDRLNHNQHQPKLRRNHNVVNSQFEIRRQESPSQKREFGRINSRDSHDTLGASEDRPRDERKISYEARRVSEEIRREKDLNDARRQEGHAIRNREPQPEIYAVEGDELNRRRLGTKNNRTTDNGQLKKVSETSDRLRNYYDVFLTPAKASAGRSHDVMSMESKKGNRDKANPIDKLRIGEKPKNVIPHADPLLNSIFNLRLLPTVQLSSPNHRTEKPRRNGNVHREEVVSQSIKVPSFQLEPPGMRDTSNLVSHSVPFKKTSQRSEENHKKREPARRISSPSKKSPSKRIHHSRGSAPRRYKKLPRDQSAKGGQQVAHVAKKPLSTAATDKGHKKGKKKEKGHHKSHKSSHKKAKGHKGDKGHHKTKGHKKVHKGHYDKKHKQGHHDKGGVFHKEDHHDEHHKGEYEKGKKGIKGYKKGKKMHHHKGHKDKGFKATHHVKEYAVNKKHYEDVDDKEYHGEHDHFDKFFEDFKKGMFKAGSFKGEKHHDKHGKKGHHKKGHHEHHDKGHDKHYGHDSHHDHHEEHGHEKGHHEKHGHDDHGHR